MFNPQRRFLNVSKKIGYVSQSITKIELKHSVHTGISWGCIGEGMVPIFEEWSVRLERGKSLEEWNAIDPLERAVIIAMRRIDIAAKNIHTASEIDSQRKPKK